jgi:MscS family membrane protein
MFEGIVINNYLKALLLFVGLSVSLRILLFFAQKFFMFFARKSKTNLDDLFIQKLSFPLTILSIVVSLIISIRILDLSEPVKYILLNSIYSVAILLIANIIYLVFNIIIVNAIKGVAKKSKVKVDETLIYLFNSLLNAVLIVLSILYILSIWGFEIGPLLAGLGIAGLAVALALQPILSNIFSGAAIVLEGSVKVGDLVYLENESIKGKIDQIGLRSTKIRTFDNEYIIIPNNKLSDSAIQNIGLPEPKSRVVVPFGVAYGSDIEKVKKVVLKEIKTIEHLDESETPSVKFLEMGDSSLNFKAFFYVESYAYRFGALDEANTKIYNALNKNKIEIPFPQMDVHLRK